MQKVNIKIEKDLLDELKIRAIHRHVTLQDLVDSYLKRMLRTKD